MPITKKPRFSRTISQDELARVEQTQKRRVKAHPDDTIHAKHLPKELARADAILFIELKRSFGVPFWNGETESLLAYLTEKHGIRIL